MSTWASELGFSCVAFKQVGFRRAVHVQQRSALCVNRGRHRLIRLDQVSKSILFALA